VEARRRGRYPRRVPLDVLTPVAPWRRRRRYRAGRVTLVLLLVLVAAGAGIWFGRREATVARHPSLAVDPPKPPATHTVSHPQATPQRPSPLLYGTPRLAGAGVRVRAPAAILVDADTGRVLWAERPHERRKIASLTKIMTATLALQQVPWRSTVTVARSVTRVPLVREGLHTGEHVEAWKLFYSLLLYSGNDDANQLAISSAGSVHAFLRRMNDEARNLGLRDTHYTSPSGIRDRGNYSTPWDLAALTRYAFRNPRFERLVRTRRIHVRWAAPTNSKIYVNNNFLLRAYRGANGVKTGYTHESGWCLVASARRHGRRLIAVVLDSPDMYADARRLLNLGFSRT
jgi:D-alanyl-D-alanine carboxypeptidase (penicillin-binding protein 5/6)